jgi:hypothetical protein
MQRGEISLPPGAEPWICACLLNPRRTNTGRRDYSGNTYPYEMRRHHLVFAVDGTGKTIVEWLQHDKYLAPPRGTGLGEMGRGPHKILMNPYDPEKHIWIVDDDMHEINVFTNDGKLVKTMGERACRDADRTISIDPPTSRGCPTARSSWPTATPARAWRSSIAPEVPDGLGAASCRSLRIRSRSNSGRCNSIGISRDRRLFVADREHHRMQVFDENGKFLAMWPTGYNSAVLAHTVTQDDFVWVADWTTDRLVKYDLEGHYILGHRRTRRSAGAV